ncbi:type IV secretion system protein [Erythrobacter sanguineus]|uniref:Type IV secretion system protein VirB6 n=1 Tax=Erythrobacter sanguineus TaxID=198312 RepID=A0A1M7S037_9SPHN|nr:type IV secretion system protein [Erythrobacter sanguineus]SHN51808.1 type IV secretion system protein VirB6 [Erythrobacter sanguineus]
MTTACDLAAQSMGTGVSAALSAVDCIASGMSEQAFNRLFGTEGQLAFALTLLLGLYVGFFGLSLMLGRSNLSVRALLPKMMTLGLVLTFATSFVAFSTIFYNIFIGGPDQIAGILTGTQGSATATFAQKLDIVFIAIQQASGDTKDINAFSPPGMMWLGAMLLLLGTVGLLVTARIGLALLLALGPIFVVLALFDGTRGLFTGWLKGLVMLALAPLFAVLGGTIMLELAVPILAALVAVPGQIDQQAAMAFFLVGAVHVALMFLALKVAATMVAGWQVFGLVPERNAGRSGDAPRALPAPAAASSAPRSANVAPASAGLAPRRVDVAAAMPVLAANDGGPAAVSRETRVYATSGGGGQVAPLNPATSRTRGIGNRFRSAGGAAPAKMTSPEKYQ